MDSVLTYLVDSSINYNFEFSKTLKKCLDLDNVLPFRNINLSLRSLLKSFEKDERNEIIISALAPYTFYEIINDCGYTPIVVDIDLNTCQPTKEMLEDKINDKTRLIINTFTYCYNNTINNLFLSIPAVDIFLTGIVTDDIDQPIIGTSLYTIFSLEAECSINTLGGSLLVIRNNEAFEYLSSIYQDQRDQKLQNINASFSIPLLMDMEKLFKKKKLMLEIFKESLLKSSYHTMESSGSNSYSFFPVILKKSLRDVQKYCKNNGIKTEQGYSQSIIKNIPGIKLKNSTSISNRTLLFPMSLSLGKEDIELISKILSTLP